MKLFSIINRKDCTFKKKRNFRKYSEVFLSIFQRKSIFRGFIILNKVLLAVMFCFEEKTVDTNSGQVGVPYFEIM